MKYLLTLILLCLSVTASAGPLVADKTGGVMYDPAELKLKLDFRPEDGDKIHVSVYGQGPRYEQVVKQFDTNPELKRLKDSAHFHAVPTSSRMFAENYAASTPAALTIRVQDSGGKVLHELRDGQIPLSAEALIRSINTAQVFSKRGGGCPDGNCRPQPDRDPPPQPVTPGPVGPPPARFPWLALIGLSVVGAGIGVAQKYYDTYKNS